MKCKLSEKCEFGNLCKDATRHDSLTVLGCSSFKTKEPMTNEQWLHTATTEQLARIIYELMWHKEKYPELCVYPVVDSVVEWLKQPHGGES